MNANTPKTARPQGGRHGFLAVTSILLLVVPAVALPAAAAQTPTLPPIGTTTHDIAALRAAGAPPAYASYWAGEWMSEHGWGGFNNAMKTARAAGVTPVVYWYYWGDSISPACVENGCHSRDLAEWALLTDQLAAQLRTTLDGQEVVVVLENEFNKGGITGTYAPTFDARLEGVAKTLKAVPGVKIVVGFGAWGEGSWEKFPKTIAQSDYIGFQMMRASTRDTEESYRGAAERSVYFTNFIAETFHKPSFLYDVALSSYPDARWEKMQAETLEAIFQRLATDGNTGLQAIVYRSLNDHYMDPKNYYGLAESHWGLRKSDGTPKPALAVWVAYASGAALAPAAPPAPPAPVTPRLAIPGSLEAETMLATKGGRVSDGAASGGAAWNLWTNGNLSTQVVSEQAQRVRVEVIARGESAGGADPRMELRVGDTVVGTYHVPAGAYRTFAADVAVPAGATSVTIAFTNDAIVNGQDRNLIVDAVRASVAPPAAPATVAPPAPFSATFSGVTGNAYWVQTSVKADRDVASVCASVDGGACRPLERKTYGYAASFHVPTNAKVTFRATSVDGATATSPAHVWPSATLASATVATAPAASATFAPYDGNAWWVQTRVASDQSVKSVCASLHGGPCKPLARQPWGAWALEMHAPSGTKVVFKATLASGATVTSSTYVWPVR